VYLPNPTGPATQHFFAIQDNYLSGAGDHALAGSASAFPTTITCWLFASGVDVRAASRVRGTVVALGDSITDGAESTQNADHRYPNFLARRLNALSGPRGDAQAVRRVERPVRRRVRTARGDHERRVLNHWIRTSGEYDAVVDFDRATRDPAHPENMRPDYDSGDHLHPGDVGYAAMARAVDLPTLLALAGAGS
jgi:lysophospholipase L1-like esterase